MDSPTKEATKHSSNNGGMADGEVTPLPMKTLACLLFLQVMDSVAFAQVTPYIAFMTKDLMNLEDEREIGKYAGFLGAAISISQFFSSSYWGRMSDVHGRRPILLMGLFGSIFATIAFGFSSTFLMAFMTRLFRGFMNGNLGVVKTCIAEITDSTNRAKAYSLIALAGGMGGMIGPVIGGFLYSPAKQYPHYFSSNGVFAQYPYLLPNLVSAMIVSGGWIFSWFYLPETRKPSSSVEGAVEEKFCDCNQFLHRCHSLISPSQYRKISTNEFVDGLEDDGDDPQENSSYSLVPVFLYGTMSIAHATLWAVWPVWAVNKVENGGVDFEPFDIGMVDLVAGGVLCFCQIFVNHRVCNFFGPRTTYRVFLLVQVPFYMFLPATPMLYKAGASHVLVLGVVSSLYASWVVVMNLTYISVYQIIQDGTDEKNLGYVNGVGQALVSITRGATPIMGTAGLSWSLTNGHGFPLNHYFVFILMSMATAIPLVIYRHLLPEGTFSKPELEEVHLELAVVKNSRVPHIEKKAEEATSDDLHFDSFLGPLTRKTSRSRAVDPNVAE